MAILLHNFEFYKGKSVDSESGLQPLSFSALKKDLKGRGASGFSFVKTDMLNFSEPFSIVYNFKNTNFTTISHQGIKFRTTVSTIPFFISVSSNAAGVRFGYGANVTPLIAGGLCTRPTTNRRKRTPNQFILVFKGGSATDLSNFTSYCDGTQVTPTSAGTLGVDPGNGLDDTLLVGPFIGNQYQVKVYNGQITTNEVNLEYSEFTNLKALQYSKRNFGFPRPISLKKPGLLYAWNMKLNGNTLPEISGSGINGANARCKQTFDGLLSSTASETVIIPDIPLSNVKTVLARVKSEVFGLNPYCGVIGTTARGFFHQWSSRALIYLGNNNYKYFNNGDLGRDGRWHTVAFTITGVAQSDIANARMFIDGIELTTNAVIQTGPVDMTVMNRLIPGVAGATNRTVECSDIQVFNRILSDQEIIDYHNEQKRLILNETFEGEPLDGNVMTPSNRRKGTGSYALRSPYEISRIGNIITNGDFSQGSGNTFTGWTNVALGTGTVTESINGGISGTRCPLLASGPSAGTDVAGIYWTASIPTKKSYRCTFWAKGSGDWVMRHTSSNGISSNFTVNSNFQKFTFDFTLNQAVQLYFRSTQSNTTLYIDNVSIEEISESALISMSRDEGVMQCTSSGTISIPLKQTIGSFEFPIVRGATSNLQMINFISNNQSQFPGLTGYSLLLSNNVGEFALQRYNGTSGINLFKTAVNYTDISIRYRVRITRTSNGVFTVYIKGGKYTGWTLVSTVGGTGTNPVTDTTYITSNFLTVDLDAGDCIGPITITE